MIFTIVLLIKVCLSIKIKMLNNHSININQNQTTELFFQLKKQEYQYFSEGIIEIKFLFLSVNTQQQQIGISKYYDFFVFNLASSLGKNNYINYMYQINTENYTNPSFLQNCSKICQFIINFKDTYCCQNIQNQTLKFNLSYNQIEKIQYIFIVDNTPIKVKPNGTLAIEYSYEVNNYSTDKWLILSVVLAIILTVSILCFVYCSIKLRQKWHKSKQKLEKQKLSFSNQRY